MNKLSIIYFIVYSVYIVYGYNVVSKILNDKAIVTRNFEHIFRRVLTLSLITLLLNGIFFLNDRIDVDLTWYLVILLLNVVVCVGYFIKFYPVSDPLTWIFHIIWSIPVFVAPLYLKFKGDIDFKIIAIVILVLLTYKLMLENYVYG